MWRWLCALTILTLPISSATSLAERISRIKSELGIDSSAPLKEAVREAHTILGTEAHGTLIEQVSTLEWEILGELDASDDEPSASDEQASPPQPPPGSHLAPRVVFLNYRRTVDGDSSRDLPDHQLAQRFHDQLHARGCGAWWSNSDIPGFGIPPGQPFYDGLADGLARTHSFVALLSQDGLARLARLTADSPCDMVLVRRALSLPLCSLRHVRRDLLTER
jgi:hypothetical protein